MKKLFVMLLAAAMAGCALAEEKQASGLTFDASKGVAGSVTMPRGEVVNYTAYTGLFYVTNVEDSVYQRMNVFVPDGADESTPIFMPNYVGGYMAAQARDIDPNDASGRALLEGYVVAIPGARGRNSTVQRDGKTVYTGRAPKALLDLKAAVRYLREFDSEIPGNTERIITNGTSAGGAMSSLMGATGNNPAYEPMLKAMGAADQRDDIYAAVCFCPIVDLDHADMAYEWLYSCTNNVTRPVTDEQAAVSLELAGQFAEYVNGLGLMKPDGTQLTADNYLDYIKELLIASAQEAKDAGAEIPDSLGFSYSGAKGFAAPVNGGMKPQGGMPPQGPGGKGGPDGKMDKGPQGMPPGMPGDIPEDMRKMMQRMGKQKGEYIVDLDMTTYLNYIVTTQPLKTPPSFDSQGVAGARQSGENEEFGDETGSSVNFTTWSLRKATGDANAELDAEIAENVRLLNPMRMMVAEGSAVSPYWYIRHGARDRDTSFPVPVNLATQLQNLGRDVDFKLPWNRPHSGDYALNEMFRWIRSVL